MLQLCLWLLCLSALAQEISCQFTQVGKMYCFKNGNSWKMRFVLHKNSDTINDLVGVVNPGTSSEYLALVGCSTRSGGAYGNREVTGDGSDSAPFILTVVIDGVTKVATPDCGDQQLPAMSDNFKWTFQSTHLSNSILQHSDVIVAGSLRHTGACDFGAMTDNTKVMAGITVNNPPPTHPNVFAERWSLFIVDNTPQHNQVSSISQMQKVQLQATLAIQTGGALGLSPKNCAICATQSCGDPNRKVSLTDSFGCPTTHVSEWTTGFTGDGVVLLTEEFTIFRFVASNFLFIKCDPDFCFEASEMDRCRDRCNYFRQRFKRDASRLARDVDPNGASRLARDVNPGTAPVQQSRVTAVVVIDDYAPQAALLRDNDIIELEFGDRVLYFNSRGQSVTGEIDYPITRPTTAPVGPVECYKRDIMIAIVTTLFVIIIVSMVMSGIGWLRLSRAKRQKRGRGSLQSIVNRIGY